MRAHDLEGIVAKRLADPYELRVRWLKMKKSRLFAERGEGRPVRRAADRAFGRQAVKPYSGPPMTLGNAASARVHLIVWCKGCGHRVEPAPAEQAQRYGAEMPIPKWRERLVCSRCGSER